MTETVKKVKIKANSAFVHDDGFYVRAGDVVEVTEAFLESQNEVCDLFERERHEVIDEKAEQAAAEQAAAEQAAAEQAAAEQAAAEQDGGKGKGKGKGKSADGESDDL
nr:MAG TPA: hypothetical protein [Caudoviricetes sp.]